MKKLNDLKNERAVKIEAMQAIVGKMEKEEDTEKRVAEQTKWDALNTEIEGLDREIKTIERQEQLNKTIVTNKGVVTSEEEKVAKRYNMFKAIREYGNNRLDGAELEMHQEAQKEFKEANQELNGLGIPSMVYKADITTTNQATQVNEIVSPKLDIIQVNPLFDRLGVQVYNDLKGNFHLPYDDAAPSYFVDEAGSLSGATAGNTATELKAARVGVTGTYTKEYLAQTSPSLQANRLADWINSIDRATMKRLFAEFDALTPLSDYTGSTATTHQMYIDLFTNVEADDSFKFATTRALMGSAMGTAIDAGSGQMIWKDGMVLGNKAFGSSLAAAKHIYAGNWAKAAVGKWGGLEIIYDIYSAKKTGKVEITVNALRDTGLANPNAFKHIELA